MNDQEPPEWFDQAPPPSANAGPTQSGKQRRDERPKLDAAEVQRLASEFFDWLTDPVTASELGKVLPASTRCELFIETAKAAVTTDPTLLHPELRSTLLTAVMKAATQGLRPDKKEGALVVRWNKEAKARQVVWQPMVWGIIKLARETGAIKGLRAQIVFHGENFLIDEVAGEIKHTRGNAERRIVAEAYGALSGPPDQDGKRKINTPAFFERIDCAYAVFDATDGTHVMRWMPVERIMLVRDASQAQWGPWSGSFVDEMILKTVILYAAKWLNLDLDSAPARAFLAAAATDMEVDFEALEAPPERQQPARLAAPGPKLDNFADMFAPAKERELVSAGQPREDEEATVIAPSHPAHERAGTTEGGEDRNPSPPSGHTDETASKPPPDPPKLKTAHERVAEIRAYIMTPGTTSADVHRMMRHDDYVKLLAWFAAHKRAEMVELGRDVSEAVDDRIGYLLQLEHEGTVG